MIETRGAGRFSSARRWERAGRRRATLHALAASILIVAAWALLLSPCG